MARRITIFDDEVAVETTVVVESATDEHPSRISSITMTATNGAGIVAGHLLTLEQFGLTLPTRDGANAGANASAGRVLVALNGAPRRAAPRNGAARIVAPRVLDGGSVSGFDDGPAAATAPARPTKATKTKSGHGGVRRAYHKRPTDSEFLAAWRRFDGNNGQMAEHFDVPRKALTNWVYGFRKRGVIPKTRD